MTKERASIFGDDDLDVSDFKPRPAHRPDPEAVREAAAAKGFTSRDPSPPSIPAAPRARRRRATGRTLQLNVRVSEATLGRFIALADRLNTSQSVTFERAIAALESELGD